MGAETADWPAILDGFAELLAYPVPRAGDGEDGGVAGRAAECARRLAPVSATAARCVERFRARTARLAPGRLEEIYTATFDLQPLCPPYVGEYLFGGDQRRGMFLVRLKERYRACHLPLDGELADHLAILLRFLGRLGVTAADPGAPEGGDLLDCCLLPAVRHMVGRFRKASPRKADGQAVGNPYAALLRGLLAALEKRREEAGS